MVRQERPASTLSIENNQYDYNNLNDSAFCNPPDVSFTNFVIITINYFHRYKREMGGKFEERRHRLENFHKKWKETDRHMFWK